MNFTELLTKNTQYPVENLIHCIFQGRGFVGHDDGCELHQCVKMW